MTSRVDVSANKLDLVVQQGKAGSVAFAFTMPQGADDLAGFTFTALGFDTTPTVTVTEASGDCTLSWTDTAFIGPASGTWELACASGDTPIFAGRLIVLAPGEAGNPTAGTYTATVGEATVTATVTLAGPAGVGVPTGGSTGQTLVKASNDNYDTEWSNAGAGDLVAANNLSELTATASTARTNLGLGGAATLNVGTTTGTVAAGDDSRLSDARTPTSHGNEAHSSTFITAAGAPVQSVNSQTGTVVLDAGDVGADPAGTASSAVSSHNSATTSVHGIADTSALLDSADIGTSVAAQSHVGAGGSAHAAAVASGAAGFLTGTDKAKLDGIEAAADVTDATNVAAAGAVMASVLTTDGDVLTRASGVPARITRADLAADSAFSALYAATSGQYAVNVVAASGATETLPATHSAHKVTMTEACEFTFSSPSLDGHTFMLLLSGAYTPTFPGSVDWDGGAAPTYATPSLFVFSTLDGGTTWLGSLVGSAYA